LSRYEAVQKFLQSKETLVVEIRRQKHNALDLELKHGSNAKISKVDNPGELSVLTDKSAEGTITAASASQQINCPSSTSLKEIETKTPVVLTLRARSHEDRLGSLQAASKETQTQSVVGTDVLKDNDLVNTITDNFIEHEHHLFEQCLEPEIDIEVFTIHYYSSTTKLFWSVFAMCDGDFSIHLRPILCLFNANTNCVCMSICVAFAWAAGPHSTLALAKCRNFKCSYSPYVHTYVCCSFVIFVEERLYTNTSHL